MSKFFTSSGEFIGDFPLECIRDCSASGQVYSYVNFWVNEINFKVPRAQAIEWLKECGAWSKEELEEMTNKDLAQKVLWLACCDIKENGEWLGLIH